MEANIITVLEWEVVQPSFIERCPLQRRFLSITACHFPIPLLPGHGPLNSMLKLLVFGDVEEESAESKAEEGRVSGTQSPSANQKAELTTGQYVGRLLLCIVGLQGAYLTWGVLQVSWGGMQVRTFYSGKQGLVVVKTTGDCRNPAAGLPDLQSHTLGHNRMWWQKNKQCISYVHYGFAVFCVAGLQQSPVCAVDS